MQWADIQESIRLAVANATGLVDVTLNAGYPQKRVEWAHRESSARMVSNAWIDLTLRSPKGIGVDQTRTDYNSGTDALVVTQCGVRTFVVSVRIESDNQDPGAESVGQLAGLLRTRLRRSSVLGSLQASGIALNQILGTVDADYRDRDGRMVSASVTDLALSAAENDTDTTDAGDYVKEVLGTGFDDLAGRTFDVKAP